jgi:hypothetical protein
MSLHQEYIGKSISFRQCPNTGKVVLVVASEALLLPPFPPYTEIQPTDEQRFEFVFDQYSAELSTGLCQLAEIIQE